MDNFEFEGAKAQVKDSVYNAVCGLVHIMNDSNYQEVCEASRLLFDLVECIED